MWHTAPVYIGAFYRSQKANLYADYVRLLERSIENIPKSASVWILGDFNLLVIDWEKNVFEPGGRFYYPSQSKVMAGYHP